VLALGAVVNGDLDRLRSERDAFAARVDALEVEVGRLTTHAAQLAAAGEKMRRERDALTASTTWRATAPLRWLRSRIR
jgi:hypothetical protein